MSLEWPASSKIDRKAAKAKKRARRARMERRLYGITDRVTRLIQGQECFYPVVTKCKNEAKRFHSTTGPAITWEDGAKAFFLDGIRFEQPIWKGLVDNTLSAKTAITLPNMTQRRYAIKKIGYAEIAKELSFQQVAEQGSYAIYCGQLEDDAGRRAYILKVKCPTTGFDYYIRIPPLPDISIHDAIAWTFGFDMPVRTGWIDDNSVDHYQPEVET